MLIEVVGVSPEMEARRHGVLNEFAELVLGVWLGSGEPTSLRRQTAVALVGGVNDLLVDWLLSGKPQQPAELVRMCDAVHRSQRAAWPADRVGQHRPRPALPMSFDVSCGLHR